MTVGSNLLPYMQLNCVTYYKNTTIVYHQFTIKTVTCHPFLTNNFAYGMRSGAKKGLFSLVHYMTTVILHYIYTCNIYTNIGYKCCFLTCKFKAKYTNEENLNNSFLSGPGICR